MAFRNDRGALTGDIGQEGEINIYTFRQETGSFNLEGKLSVPVCVGRWTVNPLAGRDKEGEADKSDREGEGQLAADRHGGDVGDGGGVYMRIGDRETAVRTLAWANTVGYDKDVLMPWQPVQIKWATCVQDWSSAAPFKGQTKWRPIVSQSPLIRGRKQHRCHAVTTTVHVPHHTEW